MRLPDQPISYDEAYIGNPDGRSCKNAMPADLGAGVNATRSAASLELGDTIPLNEIVWSTHQGPSLRNAITIPAMKCPLVWNTDSFNLTLPSPCWNSSADAKKIDFDRGNPCSGATNTRCSVRNAHDMKLTTSFNDDNGPDKFARVGIDENAEKVQLDDDADSGLQQSKGGGAAGATADKVLMTGECRVNWGLNSTVLLGQAVQNADRKRRHSTSDYETATICHRDEFVGTRKCQSMGILQAKFSWNADGAQVKRLSQKVEESEGSPFDANNVNDESFMVASKSALHGRRNWDKGKEKIAYEKVEQVVADRESDDSNESIESRASSEFLSRKRRKTNMSQDVKQFNHISCSSSAPPEIRSSFMNWISSVTNGFSVLSQPRPLQAIPAQPCGVEERNTMIENKNFGFLFNGFKGQSRMVHPQNRYIFVESHFLNRARSDDEGCSEGDHAGLPSTSSPRDVPERHGLMRRPCSDDSSFMGSCWITRLLPGATSTNLSKPTMLPLENEPTTVRTHYRTEASQQQPSDDGNNVLMIHEARNGHGENQNDAGSSICKGSGSVNQNEFWPCRPNPSLGALSSELKLRKDHNAEKPSASVIGSMKNRSKGKQIVSCIALPDKESALCRPTIILEAVQRLRLSRSDVVRLLKSPVGRPSLAGFFLRVRVGKWEEAIGGTGYNVARIDGATSDSDLVSVSIGNTTCSVDTRFVSNQDFLEDELRAWWYTAMGAGCKLPSEEELERKLEERHLLFH